MWSFSIHKHKNTDGAIWFYGLTISGPHITLSATDRASADCYVQPSEAEELVVALRRAADEMEAA